MEISEYKKNKVSYLNRLYNGIIAEEKNKYLKQVNSTKKNFLLTLFQRTQKIKQIEKTFNENVSAIKKKLQIEITSVNNITISNIKSLKKRALLIGINYTNTNYQLSGCINDINLTESYLKTKGFSQITILTDKTDKKPTRSNIISSLENFLDDNNDDEFLYFHYSGHGSTIADQNKEESDNQDETVVSSDLLNITDDELKNIINSKLNNKKTTLFAVFDSCHSGTVLDLKYTFSIFKNKLSIIENINYSQDLIPNVIMISGCKDNQYSEETLTDKGVNGLLTWAINKVLESQNLSIKDIYIKIVNLLQSIGAEQIPQLSMGSIIDVNEKIFI